MTDHADLLKAGEREQARRRRRASRPRATSSSRSRVARRQGRDAARAATRSTRSRSSSSPTGSRRARPTTPRRRAKAVAVDADHPPKYSAPPVVTVARVLARTASCSPSPATTRCCSTTPTDYELRRPADRHLGAGAGGRVLARTASSSRPPAGRPGGSARCRSGTSRSEKLLVSAPVTFDTLYGVSWSPDGKHDRVRLRRQHRAGDRRRRPASRCSRWARTPTGCSAPCSRRTGSTSSRSAAT